MAVTVSITTANYTISVSHLVNLAAEYLGAPMSPIGAGTPCAIEFTFTGTQAPANARGFRRVLDTGFVRRGPAGEYPDQGVGV